MTIARTVRATTAAALLALAAACAQNSGGTAPEAADQPDPSDVALRVEYTGGFLTPAMIAGRMPIVTVYGDGRVVSQGPQIAIYPGPALPNVEVRQIDAATVTQLIDKAVAAGVGKTADFGQPGVADAPTTRFTALTAAGHVTTEVYALVEAGESTGLTEQQTAARTKFRDLYTELTGLPDKSGTAKPYEPTALAAYATPWVAPDAALGNQPEVAWPGSELPGASLGQQLNLGCVTVTGDGVQKVLAAAAKANSATPWTSAGKRWNVIFRPLLPDESDCAKVATR
jgi:hypothetical protein